MIKIVEVKTKRDLNKFVEFPHKLYKGNKYYCPPLAIDERNNFNPKKNHAYKFCDAILFLAYRGKEIVGRVAGIISYPHCKKTGRNQARFGRFDVIDDIEVSRSLFKALSNWAIEKGMDEIIGPLGFVDIDREGMLIEGFDEYNMSITYYNHPYYVDHMIELGFIKDVDWVEYQLTCPKEVDPRLERISEHVKQRYGYRVVKMKNANDIKKYGYLGMKAVNEAFDKLYAYVPLTDEIIQSSINSYAPILNKDYIIIVTNKDDELIGFGFMVPSIAKACHDHNGHLFPFGWISLLKALKSKKNDILEMYLVAVKPEYQSTGVNAIILVESIKACIKNNARIAETGPELELNNKIQDQWKGFDARQHRRRRSWIVKIDELKL